MTHLQKKKLINYAETGQFGWQEKIYQIGTAWKHFELFGQLHIDNTITHAWIFPMTILDPQKPENPWHPEIDSNRLGSWRLHCGAGWHD